MSSNPDIYTPTSTDEVLNSIGRALTFGAGALIFLAEFASFLEHPTFKAAFLGLVGAGLIFMAYELPTPQEAFEDTMIDQRNHYYLPNQKGK
jgi:hypothetical protein